MAFVGATSVAMLCFDLLFRSAERFVLLRGRVRAAILIPRHPCEGRGPALGRELWHSRELLFRLQSAGIQPIPHSAGHWAPAYAGVTGNGRSREHPPLTPALSPRREREQSAAQATCTSQEEETLLGSEASKPNGKARASRLKSLPQETACVFQRCHQPDFIAIAPSNCRFNACCCACQPASSAGSISGCSSIAESRRFHQLWYW